MSSNCSQSAFVDSAECSLTSAIKSELHAPTMYSSCARVVCAQLLCVVFVDPFRVYTARLCVGQVTSVLNLSRRIAKLSCLVPPLSEMNDRCGARSEAWFVHRVEFIRRSSIGSPASRLSPVDGCAIDVCEMRAVSSRSAPGVELRRPLTLNFTGLRLRYSPNGGR